MFSIDLMGKNMKISDSVEKTTGGRSQSHLLLFKGTYIELLQFMLPVWCQLGMYPSRAVTYENPMYSLEIS
jgi:hypothetical protein